MNVIDPSTASSGVEDSEATSYSSSEDEHVSYKESIWYATFKIEFHSHTGSSVIETILDSVLLLLINPVPYPYVLQTIPTNEYLRCNERSDFISSGATALHCRAIAHPSIRVHEDASSNLEEFASCMHEDVNLDCPPCDNCYKRLQHSHEELVILNPTIAALCTVLLRGDIPDMPTLRTVASAFAVIIDYHSDHAEEYFNRLGNTITEEASNYWREYGSVAISEMDGFTDTAEATGICFPGRKMYRPAISFDGAEIQECNKTILRSDTHSNGILTVQCVCDTPKLLGFVVMKKPESTEVALTSILTHFRVPPRVVFYDNACNLFASALQRVPWLLHLSRMLVDRFHYKSHTCSSLFDPSSYRDLDAFKTTGAESINARIKKVLFFLRYLSGKNYVPFLRSRFALLNLGSMIRDETGKIDLEEATLWRKFQSYFVCECGLCTSGCQKATENEGDTTSDS